MIAAALVLLVAAPGSAQAATSDEEIVVIARKQKAWRGQWGTHKGAFECRTTKSTGDKQIDAIGCDAITTCIAPEVPKFQAIADSKLPKADRNRRMTALAQSLTPCLESEREAGIAALADARSGQ